MQIYQEVDSNTCSLRWKLKLIKSVKLGYRGAVCAPNGIADGREFIWLFFSFKQTW